MHNCRFDPENEEDRVSAWNHERVLMIKSRPIAEQRLLGKITLEEMVDRLVEILADNPCPCSVRPPEPPVPAKFLPAIGGFRYFFNDKTGQWWLQAHYGRNWHNLAYIDLANLADSNTVDRFRARCSEMMGSINPTV